MRVKRKSRVSSATTSSVQGEHENTHVKEVHLKLRDKQCPLCPFKATQQASLNTHLDAVHISSYVNVHTLFAHIALSDTRIGEEASFNPHS